MNMNKKHYISSFILALLLLSSRFLIVLIIINRRPVIINTDGIPNNEIKLLAESATKRYNFDSAHLTKKHVSFLKVYTGYYKVKNQIFITRANTNNKILYEVYLNINCDSNFNELYSYTYLFDENFNVYSVKLNKKTIF